MYEKEIPWAVPLSVCLQSGSKRLFASVHDALDFLENEWPVRNGQGYQRAVASCREALASRGSAGIAREAFVDACLEAGMMPTAVASFNPRTRGQRCSDVS